MNYHPKVITMKKRNLILSLVAPVAIFGASQTALAEYQSGTRYQDDTKVNEARVLSANPVYRTVRINDPVQECWDEQVHVPVHNGYRSHTPKIVGALIGAAVGNKFGSGRGRHVATAAGAVLGGSIGRDVQASNHRHGTRVEYQERCEVVDQYRTEERIEGYDVTYRYGGQTYSTFTQRDPGETIRVSVSVVPVE